MDDQQLADRFESERARLRAMAFRLLGSASEVDDALQETWLRLSRSDTSAIDNLNGWLTTVLGRICLDMLRARTRRREEPLTSVSEHIPDTTDPEHEAMQVESIGLAMLAVLQHLSPSERVAFVLHDVFGVPFGAIADILSRTPAAARKLASRARRRVRCAAEDSRPEDAVRLREIVEAFFKASRAGDFQALIELLDPNVSLRGDELALRMGARSGWLASELSGAEAVARQFVGRAQAAQVALIGGTPGAVWAPGGIPRVAFGFTFSNDKVIQIELIADPERLRQIKIEITP